MATFTVIATVALFVFMGVVLQVAATTARPFVGRIADLYISGNGWRLVNGEYEEVR